MRALPFGPVLVVVVAACSGGGTGTSTTPADTNSTPDILFFGDTGPIKPPPVDATATVLPDAAPTCPGSPSCPCSANADCNNAMCIDTPTGKQCAQPCVTDCPTGFACASVTATGGDIATICVPRWPHLCDPCKSGQDCTSLGVTGAACVSQGAAGSFCASPCGSDADCPADYQCSAVTGQISKQCLRKAEAGECPCSPTAIAAGASTACSASPGATGKCAGTRSCTAEGLSLCTAASPTTEVCNGDDDDCDGQTDEATCDDANSCTSDICDGKGCNHTPQAGPCNADDNACTQGDSCQAGACVAGPNGCTCKADADCPDDGDLCNGSLQCDTTVAPYVCKLKLGSVVSCDTSQDGACKQTACTPATGQCATKMLADGTSCTDGSACTSGDGCAGGACVPGKSLGCDDANPCTADSCDPAKGCVYTPVVGQKVSCYDGPAGTAGKGICQTGSQLCNDQGQAGACVGATKPAAQEACNGKDDTCDGITDEGCQAKDFEVAFAAARWQGAGPAFTVDMRVAQSPASGLANSAGAKVQAWLGAWRWWPGFKL